MTQQETSTKLAVRRVNRLFPRATSLFYTYPLLLCGLLAVVLAVWHLTPLVMWAYNLDRASRLAEAGLRWPEPRLVDSLPIEQDSSLLEEALTYSTAAIRWRPRHAYAYRLVGQIYAARGSLTQAAEVLEHATELEPRNPLSAWETGLVYEQMIQSVEGASRENLLPELAVAPSDVPAAPIDTAYCRDGQPKTCYVGLKTWSQHVADISRDMPLTADVLFLHPPAAVQLRRAIFPERSAMHFVVGLDPKARDWQTDGATFQIAIVTADRSAMIVYERSLSRDDALQGWHPGWVDLSPWVGQQITIELRTTGGQANNTSSDWYGWGNVTLTSVEATKYALLFPQLQLWAAWHKAGMTPDSFVTRGDQALRHSRYDEAYNWYARALLGDPKPQFSLLFRAAIAASVAQRSEARELLSSLRQRDASFKAYDLKQSVRIRGDHLRWLSPIDPEVTYGTRVASPGNISSGMLWFNGQALAVVSAATSGTYELHVRVRHGRPQPIDVAIGVDGKMIQRARLERGDDTWETLKTTVVLSHGRHTLDFWFLNDSHVGGADRNAEIAWVELTRQK